MPAGRQRSGAVEVVVMAKHPVPGEVKLRLAAALGADGAAAMYRAFVLDLADRLRAARMDPLWAVWPPGAPFESLLPGARWCAQHGADLGERMAHVAQRRLGEGAAGVVLLGADVPHVDLDAVRLAVETLEQRPQEAVVGPAEDGGYYLLGLARFVPALFRDVEWGAPQVLRTTLARLAALGIPVRQTAPGFDLDQPGDLRRLAALLRAGSIQLPRTAVALVQAGIS